MGYIFFVPDLCLSNKKERLAVVYYFRICSKLAPWRALRTVELRAKTICSGEKNKYEGKRVKRKNENKNEGACSGGMVIRTG